MIHEQPISSTGLAHYIMNITFVVFSTEKMQLDLITHYIRFIFKNNLPLLSPLCNCLMMVIINQLPRKCYHTKLYNCTKLKLRIENMEMISI